MTTRIGLTQYVEVLRSSLTGGRRPFEVGVRAAWFRVRTDFFASPLGSGIIRLYENVTRRNRVMKQL